VLHPYYRAIAGHLLDRAGIPQGLMWVVCGLELALGLWVLAKPPTRTLTIVQVGFVLLFSLGLALVDPSLLVHPLGILTKNIPFLTAAVAAHLFYRSGANGRAERMLLFGVASVWLSEGILPKIFFQSSWERNFVLDHGIGSLDPSVSLVFVGVAEALSGVLLLLLPARARRLLLYAQAAALVILPAWVIAGEPLLWLHPFAPLEKNLPILVATLLLARRCHEARVRT